MWSKGLIHGLGGGFRLPFGGGRGRLRRARAVSGDAGTGEDSLQKNASNAGQKWRFPLKAGLTSGSLAFVGDAAAQFHGRYQSGKSHQKFSSRKNLVTDDTFWRHDWVRALRMAGYGFLLYGPLSHWWYELLDRQMPVQNLKNFSLKILLNQVVLGPIVVSMVFSWTCAWTGRLNNLPDMMMHDAFPTLANGWKFWTPVSFLNFGVVPLQGRVAFMSTCAICWNYYLSTVVMKNG